ncbi:MAG: ROK family transcriptional regulator [Anaerolineae bacterium]|jgi:glucokinase-like ROK family protein|nr:ROK family transcriptional regulator [Anaerolineae bacterium]
MKPDRALSLPDSAPPANLRRGRSITGVKEHNLQAILFALLRYGPISRVDMAQLTGLSATTITNLVTDLLEQGIVEEAGKIDDERAGDRRRGAGRPRTLVRLIPDARCAAGVHIGVDTVRVGVTDLFGELQAYRMAQQPEDASPECLLALAAELIEDALAESGKCRDCLVGIGVGASGLTDPRTGVNVLAPSLGWRDAPVRDILERLTGRPVTVDNNVRAMALAESMFGGGRDVNTLAFIYSRVGVGAGFVVGGQLYRGTQYGAGEIGHTTVVPVAGKPCRCGNSGCLETLVSEGEIVRQATLLAECRPGSILSRALARETSIDAVFEAARSGDPDALGVLDDCAFHLGTTLANLTNLMNPDKIILGGVFAAGADLMLPRVEETMRRRAFAGLGERVTLAVTTFGRKVGAIGAAALALDAFFYNRQGTDA